MKKQEVLEEKQRRVMKVVLMQKIGEELEAIFQNKIMVKFFSKIEKFAEEYVHEVEMNILANDTNAKIREELSTKEKKGKK